MPRKRGTSTTTTSNSGTSEVTTKLSKMNMNDEEMESQRGFSIQQSFCLLMICRALNDNRITTVSYERDENVSCKEDGKEYRVQVKSKREEGPVPLVEPVKKLMQKFIAEGEYRLTVSNASNSSKPKEEVFDMVIDYVKTRFDFYQCRTFADFKRDKAPYEKKKNGKILVAVKHATEKTYRSLLNLIEDNFSVKEARAPWEEVIRLERKRFLDKFEIMPIPNWERFSSKFSLR